MELPKTHRLDICDVAECRKLFGCLPGVMFDISDTENFSQVGQLPVGSCFRETSVTRQARCREAPVLLCGN